MGSRGMFVGKLAVSESRIRVLLRLFVFAEFVMMGRLMVMMRCSVVVTSRLMVMPSRGARKRPRGHVDDVADVFDLNKHLAKAIALAVFVLAVYLIFLGLDTRDIEYIDRVEFENTPRRLRAGLRIWPPRSAEDSSIRLIFFATAADAKRWTWTAYPLDDQHIRASVIKTARFRFLDDAAVERRTRTGQQSEILTVATSPLSGESSRWSTRAIHFGSCVRASCCGRK